MLGSNTLNAVRSDVSLSIKVLTIPTPLSKAAIAAEAVSVLPRNMPCVSHHANRTSSKSWLLMSFAMFMGSLRLSWHPKGRQYVCF